MKTSLRRGKGNYTKALERLKEIRKDKVEVGHFEEQGEHHSGLTYVELMAYHHRGNPEQNLPARPVLDILRFRLRNLENPRIKSIAREWLTNINRQGSTEQMLLQLAKVIAKEEQKIFGDTSALIRNSPLTIALKGSNNPLIERGDLKEAVSYRTSRNPSLRGA